MDRGANGGIIGNDAIVQHFLVLDDMLFRFDCGPVDTEGTAFKAWLCALSDISTLSSVLKASKDRRVTRPWPSENPASQQVSSCQGLATPLHLGE